MDEPTSKTSLEERLRGALDKVDEFSKSASQAVKKGFDKTKKTVKDTSESIDTKDMMEKTKAGISKRICGAWGWHCHVQDGGK